MDRPCPLCGKTSWTEVKPQAEAIFYLFDPLKGADPWLAECFACDDCGFVCLRRPRQLYPADAG